MLTDRGLAVPGKVRKCGKSAFYVLSPTTMQELCAESQGAWGQGVLEGPAVVSRDDCTVWVPAGWSGSEGALGALVLRRTGGTS